jgi:hypothetical protein
MLSSDGPPALRWYVGRLKADMKAARDDAADLLAVEQRRA